jgi:hypothetical protein
MNKLYLIITLLSVFGTTTYSQITQTNSKKDLNKKVVIIDKKDEQAIASEVPYVHFWKYLFDDKKMKSIFINGKIPASFPLYDNAKSHGENKQLAKEWGLKNKKLIKKEFRNKLDK